MLASPGHLSQYVRYGDALSLTGVAQLFWKGFFSSPFQVMTHRRLQHAARKLRPRSPPRDKGSVFGHAHIGAHYVSSSPGRTRKEPRVTCEQLAGPSFIWLAAVWLLLLESFSMLPKITFSLSENHVPLFWPFVKSEIGSFSLLTFLNSCSPPCP